MMLRKARSDDMDFLLNLRNEETMRMVSINTGLIDRETHERWFNKKITDPNTLILIAEDDGQRIGQIRFDKIPQKPCAEVDIAVVGEKRAKGVGTEIIRSGSEMAFGCVEVSTLVSYIKPENFPSVKAFEKAGYVRQGIVDYRGQKCIEMKLERN